MCSQRYNIKWDLHMASICGGFKELLSNEHLVDVTLACEGAWLGAHKVVLSACSSFFRSLFFKNPCQHPIVILKDVNYMDLKSIVEFMYLGEVNVTHDQLPTLLQTAETLKVKGLAKLADDKSHCSPANIHCMCSVPGGTPQSSVGCAHSAAKDTSQVQLSQCCLTSVTNCTANGTVQVQSSHCSVTNSGCTHSATRNTAKAQAPHCNVGNVTRTHSVTERTAPNQLPHSSKRKRRRSNQSLASDSDSCSSSGSNSSSEKLDEPSASATEEHVGLEFSDVSMQAMHITISSEMANKMTVVTSTGTKAMQATDSSGVSEIETIEATVNSGTIPTGSAQEVDSSGVTNKGAGTIQAFATSALAEQTTRVTEGNDSSGVTVKQIPSALKVVNKGRKQSKDSSEVTKRKPRATQGTDNSEVSSERTDSSEVASIGLGAASCLQSLPIICSSAVPAVCREEVVCTEIGESELGLQLVEECLDDIERESQTTEKVSTLCSSPDVSTLSAASRRPCHTGTPTTRTSTLREHLLSTGGNQGASVMPLTPRDVLEATEATSSVACAANTSKNKLRDPTPTASSSLLQEEQPPSHCELYRCNPCGTVFQQKEALTAHMKTSHVGQCFYKCRYCPKIFWDKSRHAEHEDTHTNRALYKCPQCPAQLPNKNALGVHLRRHTDVLVLVGPGKTSQLTAGSSPGQSSPGTVGQAKDGSAKTGQRDASAVSENPSGAPHIVVQKNLRCMPRVVVQENPRIAPRVVVPVSPKKRVKLNKPKIKCLRLRYKCDHCLVRFIRKANLDAHKCTAGSRDSHSSSSVSSEGDTAEQHSFHT